MYYFSFLFCLLSISSRVGAELFFSSTGPYCEGEIVTITCIVQPSSGMFTSSEAAFRFNNSNICYSSANINADNTGAIDSTRYTYTGILPGSSTTNATGVLEINPFQAVDASIPFACCGDTGVGTFLMFNNSFLTLAAPPSSPSNISLSTTYNSATSCTGTITLTWLAVASNRTVTSYTVLRNDSVISTITTPMAMNSYTTGTLNLLEYYGTYTIMATSCTGTNSTSSPTMFTPLTPDAPNKPQLSYTVNYTSNFCTVYVTITWDHVVADRDVTHYEVLNDNIILSTVTTNNYTHQIDLSTQNQLQHNISVKVFNCAGFIISEYITPTLNNSCSVIINEGCWYCWFGGSLVLLLIILLAIICIIVAILLILKKRKKKHQSPK